MAFGWRCRGSRERSREIVTRRRMARATLCGSRVTPEFPRRCCVHARGGPAAFSWGCRGSGVWSREVAIARRCRAACVVHATLLHSLAWSFGGVWLAVSREQSGEGGAGAGASRGTLCSGDADGFARVEFRWRVAGGVAGAGGGRGSAVLVRGRGAASCGLRGAAVFTRMELQRRLGGGVAGAARGRRRAGGFPRHCIVRATLLCSRAWSSGGVWAVASREWGVVAAAWCCGASCDVVWVARRSCLRATLLGLRVEVRWRFAGGVAGAGCGRGRPGWRG